MWALQPFNELIEERSIAHIGRTVVAVVTLKRQWSTHSHIPFNKFDTSAP